MKSKSVFILALAVLGVAMSSCESFFNKVDQYQPTISIITPVIRKHGAVDTLKMFYNPKLEAVCMDTLEVNDTVRMVVMLQSYSNNLTEFEFSLDPAAFTWSLDSLHLIDTALLDTSRPEEGVLHFRQGFNGVVFPITYIAGKSGTFPLSMVIRSDSKFSENSAKLYQIVR